MIRTVARLGRGAVGGLLLAVVLMAACAPAARQGAPASGQAPAKVTATIGLPGVLVESMNPYAHSTTQVYPTWKHVLQPLVQWDWERKALEGVLATSWTAPDPNTWVFQLRQGVRFHDGSEFTSADVIHSYQRIQNDADSKQNTSIAEIDAMEAPDRYTVRLHTKSPDAAIPFRLSQRFITSKAVYDRLGALEADKLAIGTGPYKFREFVPAQRFVLVKNPDYALETTRPTVDEVVFRIVKEQEAAIAGLLNGEFDLIANVSPESVGRLTGSVRPETVRAINIMFLAMNPQVAPQFQNKLVRQAVNYAIDRKGITEGVLKGRGYPLDAPIGPDQYGYSPDLQPKYEYNVQRARELMAQAGLADGFEVEFLVPTGQYSKDKEIATAIASMLEAVRIRARMQTPDQASGFKTIQDGKAALYLFGRGSVIDPSEYLHQYLRTGVSKRLQFSNPDVDALLMSEQATFDPAERVKLLQQAMGKMLDEAAMAWLFQYQGIQGVNNRFDYTPNPGEDLNAWDLRPRASR